MTGSEQWGELRGARAVRHWGDPPAEWLAATEGVAVRDRSHRTRMRFHGRQPGAMLAGVITGRLPQGVEPAERGEPAPSRMQYSLVLTPKGRVVSDFRLFRESPGDDPAADLIADVPQAGAEALRAHLARYLPPRMCAVEDISDVTAHLTVMGPQAAELLAREAFGLRLEADRIAQLAEDEGWRSDVGGERPLSVFATREVSTPAWDVFGDARTVASLRARLLAAGARAVGSGVWEALRLEAGRPTVGAELDENCIPLEAGIDERAIDHTKGCYTGQEVIVRIRHRGHVNRHLRRLRLGDLPAPAQGTELFVPERESSVGQVTSVATSPRLGSLALAYLRREVEVPGPVHLGAADGPEVSAEPLPDS